MKEIRDNYDTSRFKSLPDRKCLADEHKPGVYVLTHKKTKRQYVGSSRDVGARVENYYESSYVRSKESKIFKAVQKEGITAFTIHVIEYCRSEGELHARESFWVNIIKPSYNMRKVGRRFSKTANANIEVKMSSSSDQLVLGQSDVIAPDYQIVIKECGTERVSTFSSLSLAADWLGCTSEDILQTNGKTAVFANALIPAEYSLEILFD